MRNIIEKVERGENLSLEEGLKLYELDIFTLGKLADKIRKEMHGKKSYYNVNRHINPTNICDDVCKFCAYSANRKNPNPYTMTHEEILDIVENSSKNGITEVHIVSAHNGKAGLNWYMDIFKKIKEKYPQIHIKALTAAEIDFLAREYSLSYDEVIDLMIKNGVDSMPGGGAEVFDERTRDYICKGKVSSSGWLEIHELWHKRGRKSNATMLFGHVESRENRIDHMIRLRELQDKTGGFNAFIPLVYQTENNYLKIEKSLTGNEFLKTMAISRIMLRNIPNIKAYWVTSTVNMALLAQEFGANDLDGTIERESINSSAGADSRNGIELKKFLSMIKSSGFEPVERDSLYNEIERN
ncbi:putative menaquinone biosynthesis protein, SCO4494 family [Thiovulum sp. ES]|nr:putative menaquinone biosynthesis protein, SCO4494 family [Thiovulum sp. ES]